MTPRQRFEGAAAWVPEGGGLRAVARALEECRGCDLWADALQAVPGRGPAGADLVLVGEQPGDVEDQQGEAFVGPAGRLLDEALEAAGIDADTVYLTNAVKHFRHEGTRGKRRIHKSPSRSHVLACEPWLDTELERIRPRGVVVLGATAASALLGPGFKVTQDRGHVLDWPQNHPLQHEPDWVVATVHPSAVLRSEDRHSAFAGLVDDLAAARARLGADG